MSRRNQSLFEDLIDIATKLPWWIGVLLAVVAYVGLHQYAAVEIPNIVTAQNMGASLVARLLQNLAMFGQYLLPVCFLIGALFSAMRRHKRHALHATVSGSPSRDVLEGMSWQDFEKLVGEGFRQRGFRVSEVGGGGADGGVDLVLHQGSDKYLVQCKQWKAMKVGVVTVRELFGVMAAQGAVGGYVVSSGQFSKEARNFAAGQNIELIDGDDLHKMIRSVERPSSPPVLQGATPECPSCGNTMVKRIARRSAKSGTEFWGCTKYPACKGTRSIG